MSDRVSVKSLWYAQRHPSRVAVHRTGPGGAWEVWRGLALLATRRTFAEAIVVAQRIARISS